MIPTAISFTLVPGKEYRLKKVRSKPVVGIAEQLHKDIQSSELKVKRAHILLHGYIPKTVGHKMSEFVQCIVIKVDLHNFSSIPGCSSSWTTCTINSVNYTICILKTKKSDSKRSRRNSCLFFPFNLLFVRGFLKMPSYVQEIFNDPPVFLNSSKSEREKLKVVKSIFKQLQRWFYLFSYIVFPTAHSLAALSSLSKISLSSPFLA